MKYTIISECSNGIEFIAYPFRNDDESAISLANKLFSEEHIKAVVVFKGKEAIYRKTK